MSATRAATQGLVIKEGSKTPDLFRVTRGELSSFRVRFLESFKAA